jgi:hypothetical protein
VETLKSYLKRTTKRQRIVVEGGRDLSLDCQIAAFRGGAERNASHIMLRWKNRWKNSDP